MRILSRLGFVSVMAVTLLVVAAPSSLGAEEHDSTEIKAHLKVLDSGPKKIDVSKYPAAEQSDYKLFVKKCSKCHTIARPINSDFVLPSQWERYIKRMMYKPNSGLNDKDAKAIYTFLVYDASVRKTAMLKEQLGKLSTEDRAAAIGKIKGINPAYVAP